MLKEWIVLAKESIKKVCFPRGMIWPMLRKEGEVGIHMLASQPLNLSPPTAGPTLDQVLSPSR
jgi:hypothetical protein